MLARLLIIAMLSGVIAAILASRFGFSLWMLPVVYSLAGTMALLVGGALVGSMPASAARLDRAMTEPLPVRVRH